MHELDVLHQKSASGGCVDALVPANTTETAAKMMKTRRSMHSRRAEPQPDPT